MINAKIKAIKSSCNSHNLDFPLQNIKINLLMKH